MGLAVDILELQQCLDDLSSWRKKELAAARALAEQAKTDEDKKYLCRVWALIMYAHCDNFLKEATRCYVRYIRQSVPSTYRADIIWLIFKGKDNATDGADDKYVSFLQQNDNSDLFFSAIESDAVFERRSFKFKTLRFFCDWVLQIPFEPAKRKLFCDTLEEKRNAIAHGEEAYVNDIQDCVKWHEETIGFMDALKDSIVCSVR